MAIEPVYLHSNLYPKYLAEIAALASEGFNIVLIQNPFRCRGKSVAPKVELPKPVEFARPTHCWIDEAPNVSTIGQVVEPKLSFLAKCVRQCFTLQQDNTYVQNA
jgi:hypothetical protein